MILKIIQVFIFSLFLIILSIGCGDEDYFASQSQCDGCISPKPITGSLIINFTEQKSAGGVVLKIYKGFYSENSSENNLIAQDTVETSPYYLDNVDVNENYAVEATYITGTRIIKVIDGSELKVSSIKATCNTDCWIYKGGEMDCRLKF